jgi:peptidoglycan/xylan/chitin deacetylase (PgdA/CDA1 family)
MKLNIRRIWEKNWPEFSAAVAGGFPQFVLARSPCRLGSRIPAFSYHVIDNELFELDLDFLSTNRYVTIDADTLLRHIKRDRQAPSQAVVLTFDDGARNLYEVAFPLLKHYGMKAVAFISPGLHGDETNESWQGSSPLSWSQIREMHESGLVDFQSHTYEHRYIPRWPEPVDLEGSDGTPMSSMRGLALSLEDDLRLAKNTLEEKLGKTVRHLAFPRYRGTKEALRIGNLCGYEAFWWGPLPHRPHNRPGQSPAYVVRINGRYLRRLPGDERVSFSRILLKWYRESALRGGPAR